MAYFSITLYITALHVEIAVNAHCRCFLYAAYIYTYCTSVRRCVVAVDGVYALLVVVKVKLSLCACNSWRRRWRNPWRHRVMFPWQHIVCLYLCVCWCGPIVCVCKCRIGSILQLHWLSHCGHLLFLTPLLFFPIKNRITLSEDRGDICCRLWDTYFNYQWSSTWLFNCFCFNKKYLKLSTAVFI